MGIILSTHSTLLHILEPDFITLHPTLHPRPLELLSSEFYLANKVYYVQCTSC